MPLRVAAYCRVSTDREDQAHSLHSQQTYFRAYIEHHDDWALAQVYADEGISGTSTRRREAFNRMVRDADAGKFDLILTKEVSRFARNTVDTLEYTRHLKQNGIGIIFINDNIDTRDNDGELRLTIMASMAQEESRKTSERVKWGQRRRMEAGVVFGNDSTYGFETRGGRLFVRPEEAEVVRHIYHKYLHEGKGTHVIARELYEEGIPPPQAATGKWSCVMVRRILRNEKYVGDLLQKKFVTTDFLTHRKVENRGLEEQVYLRDHHAAVVDRPTWEAVQAELARRRAAQKDGTKYSGRYWCSGKIRCGACGSRFVLRTAKRASGRIYKSWGCHSRIHYGNWKSREGEPAGCGMRMVNDKTLMTCVRFVFQRLNLDYDRLAAETAAELWAVLAEEDAGAGQAEERRAVLERKKERVLDAYFSGRITEEEMVRMKERYTGQLGRLTAEMRERATAPPARWSGPEELTPVIRAWLDTSEELYRESVERVTVWENCLTVKVRFLPEEFKLWYETAGKGESYTTVITKWELCPPEMPT